MALPIGEMQISTLYYNDETVPSKNGGKSVFVGTQFPISKDNRLVFQMCEKKFNPTSVSEVSKLPSTPFGIQEPLAGSAMNRLSMEIAIENKQVLESLKTVDKLNIEAAVKYSSQWFKKEFSEEQIKMSYTPIVKFPEDSKYNPTTRVKIQTDGDRATTIMVALKGSEDGTFKYKTGSIDDISKTSKMAIICETTGLWIQNKGFGMSFTATDIIVFNEDKKRGIDAFGFVDVPVKKIKDDSAEKG